MNEHANHGINIILSYTHSIMHYADEYMKVNSKVLKTILSMCIQTDRKIISTVF